MAGKTYLRTILALPLSLNSELWTGASLLRKSATLEIGNFNALMKYREDVDLGQRLLTAGYSIVRDPELVLTDTFIDESLLKLLDRRWRWYRSSDLRHSLKNIHQSFRDGGKRYKSSRHLCSSHLLLSPYYHIYRALRDRLCLKDN